MEWGLTSHAGTGVSTALTGLRAVLAMLHCVLGALSGTSFANLGAKRTHRLHVVVSTRNRRCGQAAYIGAFHVQFDAANHCFGVVLLEAGAGALKASCCTCVARKKAFFLDLTKHFNLRRLSGGRADRGAVCTGSLCADTLRTMERKIHPQASKSVTAKERAVQIVGSQQRGSSRLVQTKLTAKHSANNGRFILSQPRQNCSQPPPQANMSYPCVYTLMKAGVSSATAT